MLPTKAQQRFSSLQQNPVDFLHAGNILSPPFPLGKPNTMNHLRGIWSLLQPCGSEMPQLVLQKKSHMMADLEMEIGKSPRLASGQREIGRKVKEKEYVISVPSQRERISH